MTFCNICVITEDIYFKLYVCVHYPKGNPCYEGGQFKMQFFSELCPFFDLDFLSSIKHPTAERWRPHAVLLFFLQVSGWCRSHIVGFWGYNFIFRMFNPFSNKPWFLRVCNTILLKTLWEKEKLLVMSNFPFFQSTFYPSVELYAIFIKFEIAICKPFQFGSA